MTFTNHAQNDFDLSNTLTLLRYFTHAYPPKAKVRGSNPLGCAKPTVSNRDQPATVPRCFSASRLWHAGR